MRVVVVGLGAAAERILLPAIRAIPDLQLAAACDTDAAARARAARALRCPVHAAARDAIDEGRPDLVVVAAPPASHREIAIAALDAGAHVFCEKPFVPSVPDADAILAAAARAGRQVAVDNQYLAIPAFAAIRDAVRGGAFGDLLFLSAWQTMLEPPARESGWRGTMRRRTLFEFGNHAVDLLIELAGGPPRAVTCATSSDGSRAWDAFVALTLHFAGGRMASLVIDRASRGRWRYLDMRVECARATLRASLGGEARVALGVDGLARVPFANVQVTRGGFAWVETGERRRVLARNPAGATRRAARDHLAAFVGAIAAGRPFARGAAENRAVIETIAAAYLAADRGRRVDLEADRDAIAAEVLC
jgi:predicted dehydrogenase